MSLIVARRTETNIILISDTKLSSLVDRNNQPPEPVPVEYGVLKLVILDSHMVIGFAGEVDSANEAIQEVVSNPSSAVAILHSWNTRTSGRVDFLLARSLPNFELTVVKNGQVHAHQTAAWIGSHRGFNAFQGYATGQLTKPRDPINPTSFQVRRGLDTGTNDNAAYQSMLDAMEDVIASGRDETIDGIAVPVAYQGNKFSYISHCAAHRGVLHIDPVKVGPEGQTLDFGSASLGSHVLELVECSSPQGTTLAIYHMHGRSGIYYQRIGHGLPRPTFFSSLDDLSFRLTLRSQHGVECGGLGLGLPIDYYWSKCHKLVAQGDYAQAEPLLDIALAHFHKNSERWKLLQVRGLAAVKQGIYARALRDLTKAISLKPDEPPSYLLRGNAFAQICQSMNREALLLAERDYLKAIELKPGYETAEKNLVGLRFVIRRMSVEN